MEAVRTTPAGRLAAVRGIGGGVGGGGPEFRFRIVNALHYFAREYNPADTSHELRIGFESEADLQKFRAEVLPLCRELARETPS